MNKQLPAVVTVPTTLNERAIDKGFRWRTRGGVAFLCVTEMETRHVFFTWLMIWNHACPKHLRHPMGKIYDGFDKFYTPDYMLQAFRVMFNELAKRKDVEARWIKVIQEVLERFQEAAKLKGIE